MRTPYLVPGLFMLLATILAVPAASAEPVRSPGAFVTTLAHKAMTSINSKALSSSERQRQLEGLVDADFDLPRISSFLLGHHWRTASETERRDFTAVLRAFIARLYHQRFSASSGHSFRIVRQIADTVDSTMVYSEVSQSASSRPVAVGWRVIDISGYRIIDISVAGISMAQTKRDEFTSFLRSNGGDLVDLTERLQVMLNAQPTR